MANKVPQWSDAEVSANLPSVRATGEGPTVEFKERFPLDISRDPDATTQALYQAFQSVAARIGPKNSADDFLTAFRPMVPIISQFFVDVLVMADDPAVRETRLALLQRIAALPQGIVDLSKVEGF